MTKTFLLQKNDNVFHDLSEELVKRFWKICEEKKWLPLIHYEEQEVILSFLVKDNSLYKSDIELTVRGKDMELAVLRVIS